MSARLIISARIPQEFKLKARIHFISVVYHLLFTHAAGMLSGNIERQISSTQLDVLIPERTRMDQGVSRVGPTIAGWWWLSHPSDKYEFVSWGYDISNIWQVIKAMLQNAPNQIDLRHQSLCCFKVDVFSDTSYSLSRNMSECFRGPSQSYHSMPEE